jgi:ferritin-like protein
MGTRGRGREIVNMDVTELLNSLNKAFADEWLGYLLF